MSAGTAALSNVVTMPLGSAFQEAQFSSASARRRSDGVAPPRTTGAPNYILVGARIAIKVIMRVATNRRGGDAVGIDYPLGRPREETEDMRPVFRGSVHASWSANEEVSLQDSPIMSTRLFLPAKSMTPTDFRRVIMSATPSVLKMLPLE